MMDFTPAQYESIHSSSLLPGEIAPPYFESQANMIQLDLFSCPMEHMRMLVGKEFASSKTLNQDIILLL